MAKKQLRFKPTPAGILFLSAIAILLIAIVVLIIWAATGCGDKCKKNTENDSYSANDDPNKVIDPNAGLESPGSNLPETSPAIASPGTNETLDPNATPNPDETPDPNTTPDPNATPGAITTNDPSTTPGDIVLNTPGQTTTSASPGTSANPTPKIYTSPTSKQKKNAQKGYVSADKVRMRKGPGTNYDLVKSDIAKYTSVTLYEEQSGWWFLKCGDKYGYIRKDLVSKGSAPSTPSGSSSSSPSSSSEASGSVIASKIALRKDANDKSDCLAEYKKGEKVTVYYYTKDSSGRKWYYVKTSDGKKGYMFAEYVKVSGKVNSK